MRPQFPHITCDNDIGSYAHCRQCFDELPGDTSPREFARLSVGFTKLGLQVWCDRHNVNVMHIDFEGAKHPANVGPASSEGCYEMASANSVGAGRA